MKADHQLNCSLEILTPVHVGSGETWQQHVDFHLQGREVIVVSHEKLYEALYQIPESSGQTALDKYTQILSAGNTRRLEDYVRGLDINWQAIAAVRYEYPNEEPAQEIRTLNRSMGRAYLPGSSIKGAILSVLINTVKRKRRLDIGKYRKEKKDWRLIDDTIGRFDRSISRFIRPVDVAIEDTALCNIQLFNLYQNFDWESDFKTRKLLTVESFPVGAHGQFPLSINVDLLKRAKEYKSYVKNERYLINYNNPIQELFYLVNRYTYGHLEKEVAFFENYNQAEETEDIIHNLKQLQAQTLDNPNSCILRLGFGSGFHAITGDWMFGSHLTPINQPHRGKRYKSRRLANYQPMGFVKLTLPEGVPRIKPWKVIEPSESPQPQPSEPKKTSAEYIGYSKIQKEKPLSAEVIKIGKPFSTVKLHIKDYPFEDDTAQMSGTKKVKLELGQVVRVLINSQTADGQIKTVKYLRS